MDVSDCSANAESFDSFVMIEDKEEYQSDEDTSEFEVVGNAEDSDSSEDEEDQQDNKFHGIRPVWVSDASVTVCTHCELPFTFFRRRHHCRFCGQIFCNKCCHVQASYPVWFGYDSPQRVCEECIPQLFDRRQSKMPENASISIVRCNSSPQVNKDGFQTAGEEILSFPLRFLHPLCRFAFWFSGMYEGGSFNRKYLNTAANMNLPFVGAPVKSIVRQTVEVPKQWPSYGDESWETYSVTNLEQIELSSIPVFIFTPLTSSQRPLPVLVWYHGGGFCLGSAENMVYQTICRSLAHRTRCIVVSVEYRLAPEFKFPTQVEDAYSALKWVHSHAKSFGGDPERLAVGGDSAGGSLSAVVSILARERKFPVPLLHQLLVYPCITNPLTDDLQSHIKYKEGPVLSRKVCDWFMRQVFDDIEEGLKHPFASPLHLESHHDLPPATIINAMHDPLCDHGKLYAKKLRKDGVSVTRSVYRKSLHGFFGSSIGESTEALVEASSALRNAFSILDEVLLDENSFFNIPEVETISITDETTNMTVQPVETA